jgi:hypothetical protein
MGSACIARRVVRNAYEILIGNPVRKRPLVDLRAYITLIESCVGCDEASFILVVNVVVDHG